MRTLIAFALACLLVFGTWGCGPQPEDNPDFRSDTEADPGAAESPSATPPPAPPGQ